MMSKPDSEMDGTICKECNRLISDHLPEELEECVRKSEFKRFLKIFVGKKPLFCPKNVKKVDSTFKNEKKVAG